MALATAALMILPGLVTDVAPELLRALLTGSVPGWVTADNAHGDTPSGLEFDFTVNLALRAPATAEAFAAAVSDPANVAYQRFLTPAQYKTGYAATDETVQDVRSWLADNGLQIVTVSATNRSIRVRGSGAQIEAAFDTELKLYAHNGELTRAPSTALSVPAQLEGAILSIGGLTLAQAAPATAPLVPASAQPAICSRYHGEKYSPDYPVTAHVPAGNDGADLPLAVCGYTPQQVRSLYGIDALTRTGLDGRGRTVAIVGAYTSPTIVADTNTWAARRGEPPLLPGQFRQDLPTAFAYGHEDPLSRDLCEEQRWQTEQTLDVEAVHGMAPGASILYVAAASCQSTDLIDAVQRVVDGQLADVVSGSFSFLADDEPPGDLAAAHAIFVQAAAQGIGLFFSSGDDGDNLARTGARGVEHPASDPLVTAVGGTSAGISQAGSRLFELGWQTASTALADRTWQPAAPGTFEAGGGGGVSGLFPQPRYQVGIVPPAISTYLGDNQPGRAVPDVAALADPYTGYLIGQTQRFSDGATRYVEYRLGGTSLATPLVVGIAVLANQLAGRPLGFANYSLYRLSNSPAFTDPKSSDRTTAVVDVYYANNEDPSGGYGVALRTFNRPQTINLRSGYDDVTGLGTPNGIAFVAGLANGPP
ncbi:Pro-kumamolisin, activation domain [Frankia sp. Hr75.2]|nr:Pro-kumamolisin, activation domain [Frankia sp. Hr75.2]